MRQAVADATRLGLHSDVAGIHQELVGIHERAGDYKAAFQGIRAAVKDGTITLQRLDESVLRILALKEKYGIIK